MKSRLQFDFLQNRQHNPTENLMTGELLGISGYNGSFMNIHCIHCGEKFLITKEQLGTRGKCPHCRGVVVLPKSKRQASYRDRNIAPPSRAYENSFSAFAAFVVHLLLIILLAMIPWGQFSSGEGGEGDQIMIGQLSREQLVDSPSETLQPMQFENQVESPAENLLQQEQFSPDALNPVSENEWDVEIGAISSGAQTSIEIQSVNDRSVLAGGAEAFGKMVSRLKKDGLDIVIVFDSTGSMQGEINVVKSQIERIGGALIRLIPKTRISVCTYRDRGDEYIVKGLPLTDDIGLVTGYLDRINAKGGGDQPEAVKDGLQWAIEKNRFRQNARKVILLFGDAPPHSRDEVACQSYASRFFHRQRGIISTVTCHKESRLKSFETIAKLGGGESFLTRDEREIMKQLIVLVFGSQYRSKVMEVFDLQ